MPKNTLTDITLRKLKPPASGQLTVWDSMPNFGVRVGQGGAKSFVVLLGRTGHRHTIGRYPVISLQDARGEAKRLLAERTLGKARPAAITFEEAVPIFLNAQYQGKRDRSRKGTEGLLTRHFLRKLRSEKVSNLTTQKIAGILDDLTDTPSEQAHAFTAIGTFLRWSVARRYLDRNPCEGMKYAKGKPRTRVLTDAELTSVWGATGEGGQFDKIVRLLLLLGQRRGETGLLRGEYINRRKRSITLPAAIVKNNREHTFPYGDMAAAIIEGLPSSGYLFPGIRGETFTAWAPNKRELDEDCPISHWTLHDLRRTFATNLAALKVPPHIVERLLNHTTGTISGVAAIYNRHAYEAECREAIQQWETRLKYLIGRAAMRSYGQLEIAKISA